MIGGLPPYRTPLELQVSALCFFERTAATSSVLADYGALYRAHAAEAKLPTGSVQLSYQRTFSGR